MRVSFANVADVFARAERLVPVRTPERSIIGYGIYTAVLFVCFLVTTFPVDVIAQRLVNRAVADSGWTIRYSRVRLVPWAGFSFSNLSFESPQRPGQPAFQFTEMALRPSLRTFLGKGFRRVSFRGEAYEGTVVGSANWAEVPSFDLTWTDVNLAQVAVLSTLLEGNWVGRFSGEAHLLGRDYPTALEGGGKLEIKNVALTRGSAGGFRVPDLHFTQGASELEVKGGNLEIRNLKLSGPEIDVDIKGQVSLRKPVAQSALNVTLGVRPVPGGPAELENALKLLNGNRPSPTGTYSYSISGVLSAPRARELLR